jgi:hypothetical protein
MKLKQWWPPPGIGLLALPLTAQPAIDWFTFSIGTGLPSGGVYQLRATIGQLAAGPSTGGSYTLEDGFWSFAGTGIASGELIVNGSFENLAATFVPDAYGMMSLQPGSTIIPGWTITDAELAWGDNANTFGAITPFGQCFVELTGYHDQLPYSGVRQVIATTPGQRYRLSLSLGSNSEYTGAGGQKQVRVQCGEAATTFTFDPVGTPVNEWSTFSFPFVATANSTPVTISGLNATGIYLPLDNVFVMPEVAELKILAVARTGNALRLRFAAVDGHTYVVESRSTMSIDHWQPIPETETSGSDETVEVLLDTDFSQPQRFYRLRANAEGRGP